MSGNPANLAGGHKANLSNPNTSEESKQHSRDVLENDLADMQTGSSGSKNEGNVAGGYKATLKNPNVSDEAKQNAEQKLSEMGAK
ncbi:hypothetical protein MMC10_000771 [Thelotrema lepadinum]|nr:hypothetical protein [Thelotrema lepadinum]